MTSYNFSNNWIDRFHDGDLTPSERELFLRELESDPKLMKEFRLDKKIEEFLSDAELIDLLRKIHKIRLRRSKKRGLLLLLAAASMLSLLIISLMIFSAVDYHPGVCRKKSDKLRDRQPTNPGNDKIPRLKKRNCESCYNRFPGITGSVGTSDTSQCRSVFASEDKVAFGVTPTSRQLFQPPPVPPAEDVPHHTQPWREIAQDSNARTQRSWLQNFPCH